MDEATRAILVAVARADMAVTAIVAALARFGAASALLGGLLALAIKRTREEIDMEKIWNDIVKWTAAAAGVLVGCWGGWTPGSRVLVILMAVDYFTGLACALTGHSAKTESGHFWSKVAFLGLLKKGVLMLVILVAAQLDQVMGGGEGVTLFRSAAEFFYIASEGLSVVENAGLLGVPVPKGIKQALEVLRDKNDEENR